MFLVFFGEYNGFYAQRRAYFTLAIDSPHHGLSNELLYVAIGHFKVILSQNGVCLGPLTAGFQVNSSTCSSRSNYVRVNAKRTYILLVHGALRWYIVLTYLPCVARWPAPPGVLTCSASAARLRRGYLLPLLQRPSDVTQRSSDVTQRPSTAANGHRTSLNGHLTSPNQLRST